jgi:hypothetical protein
MTMRALLTLLLCLGLAACGDFGSLSDTRVRLVNATSDGYDALDLYVDGDREITGVRADSVSGYTGVEDGEASLALARTGSSTLLAASNQELAQDEDHTHVAYGAVGTLRTVLLTDDEDEPDSGKARVRLLNGAIDAGAIDVYLTAPGDPLDDASPVAANVAPDALSNYTTINSGNYRLRVTAAGDRDDVRLDVPLVALASRQVSTLIVGGTPGGVLVDAALVEQGGPLTAFANRQARVRVVAAIAGGARVGVDAGGTTLAANLVSPQIGPYALVTAGSLPLTVRVDGNPVTAPVLDAAPGTDLSVLVFGRADAPLVRVLVDDNKLPTTADSAKLRLVHAVAGLPETMTLQVGFTERGTAGYGQASTPSTQAAGSGQDLQVTSPTPPTVKFSLDDLRLDANSVYTVFMLGSFDAPATTLSATLRKER